MTDVHTIIAEFVRLGQEFTTDDLRDQTYPMPDRKTLGIAIEQAVRLGTVRPTSRHETSRYHGRPVRVWEPNHGA